MKHFLLRLSCLCLMFISSNLMAQSTVSGRITDSSGEALIGASVIIEGTTDGTTTDVDGNYRMSVPDGAVLIFRYIGFVEQRITVGNQTSISITLAEDATQLDEVVVSALGIKQNRDAMGATVSTIRAADALRSGEAGFAGSLAGKASNVIVNNSTGDPGAGTTIKIRGSNSLSGTTSPLIILDGIPISNQTIYGGGNNVTGGRSGGTVQQSRLNDINPNDIESVTVLKGASAASLWGSRAANGVIVITTKNGSSGKMKVTYKATYSFDKVHERLAMQNTYGQGQNGVFSYSAESWGDYIPDRPGGENINTTAAGQFYRDDNRNGINDGPDDEEYMGFFTAADGSVHYRISPNNQSGDPIRVFGTDAALPAWGNKQSQNTFVEENWDAVFQTGGYTQHDVTVSGGKEDATFFLSVSRLDQEGIIRNSDYNRTNLRLNSRFKLAEWLTVSSKAGYISSRSNRIQQSSNTAGLLLGLLRNAPDYDIRDYIGAYTSSSGQITSNRHSAYRSQIGSSGTAPAYNNPLWTIFEQTSESKVDRFTMSGQVDITANDWLSFTARGGVDSYTDTRPYFFPVHSAGDRNPGIYALDNIKNEELNFDLIGNAKFELTDEINLQATAGFNINDRRVNTVSSSITGFLANVRKSTADLNSDAASSSFDDSKSIRRSTRGYGVLVFDMFNQLTVTTSGAVEAASSISGSTFYPSVDAAWRLGEVIDLSSTPITFAKLRASWGKVGVQPAPHRFETTAEGGFTYSSYDSELDVSLHGGGFRLNDDLGNPSLKPEIKTEWEIGADFRLFDNKMNFTITYYQNEIKDLLLNVDLTPSGGFDTQYANGATMENKGLEFEIDYAAYDKNDWIVNAFINWSTNKNEVTDLLGTETINLSPGASVSSRAIVGQPLGVLYGTGSLTNDDGTFDLDANGFPQLTPSPIVLGDPNPDWRSGFGFNVGWKKLSMNVLFEHSHGGDFSPRTQWVLRRFGTTAETANTFVTSQELTNFDGDVIPSGTRVRGNIEDFGGGSVLLDETWYRHGIGGGFGDNQAYNFSIKDAQYTRLRELSISYTLDSQGFRSSTKLSSVVLTATGRNLFLWDNLEGVDPQVNQTGVGNAQGLDYFTNPSTKSFLFSIAVNF